MGRKKKSKEEDLPALLARLEVYRQAIYEAECELLARFPQAREMLKTADKTPSPRRNCQSKMAPPGDIALQSPTPATLLDPNPTDPENPQMETDMTGSSLVVPRRKRRLASVTSTDVEDISQLPEKSDHYVSPLPSPRSNFSSESQIPLPFIPDGPYPQSDPVQSCLPSEPTDASPTSIPRPPPIYVEPGEYLKLQALSDATIHDMYTSAAGGAYVRLMVASPEHHRALTASLGSHGIQYSTFRGKDTPGNTSYIIRGLPLATPLPKLEATLRDLGFSGSLRQLTTTRPHPGQQSPSSKRNLPLFELTLPAPSPSLMTLSSLWRLPIKVELARRKSGPTQCHSCQRFGHTSRYCGYRPRCHRCAGDHHFRSCTKPTTVPASCINCGGSHPANYTRCPSYLSVAGKSSKTPVISPPSPPTLLEFPPLNPNVPTPPLINAWKSTAHSKIDLADLVRLLTAFETSGLLPTLQRAMDTHMSSPSVSLGTALRESLDQHG